MAPMPVWSLVALLVVAGSTETTVRVSGGADETRVRLIISVVHSAPSTSFTFCCFSRSNAFHPKSFISRWHTSSPHAAHVGTPSTIRL